MCFGALTDSAVRTEPVPRLLRAEAGHAARQGVVTALAVLVVLLAGGVTTPLAATAAAVAFVAATVVHQVVLLVAVTVLRWRADGPDAAPRTA
ncbi:MAG: hypothetical protein ACI9CA_000831 [Natronomonas sp.]|jgi:hypothetical protein